MRFASSLVMILSLVLVLAARVDAQPLCGPGAPQDVVLILDLTKTQSAAHIEQQKAGARALLDAFSNAAVKPQVAIATMNTVCSCGGPGSYDPCDEPGEVSCYAPGIDEARIVVPLSANYTNHYAQLQANAGIRGQGPGFDGLGGTNIKRALEVAQQHLETHGSAWPNNIVLLSDGQPNLPGYYWFPFNQCNDCNCDMAEAEAQNAADVVKAMGTKIFTVLSGAPCGGGAAFLRDVIATNPSYHFTNPNQLPQLFQALAQEIGCNDGNSCTYDVCNNNSPRRCEFLPIDSDGDGTPDCSDGCPLDPHKVAPGACGCGVADTDSDGDGTPNCHDNCPSDPNKVQPGVCGCGVADVDTDGDGVLDCQEQCPLDPLKTLPGVCGCGVADADSDGDGMLDCRDACPYNPSKVEPGVCGCGALDVDSDGDGVFDCHDQCPLDPHKSAPGACGCGVADIDSDGDGTPDCLDQCPNDPNKAQFGLCGCGFLDTDTDGDGTPDCLDQCPLDAEKHAPGACGCGVPDTDSDGDGTPDCTDQCSNDPWKVLPGACGCGVSDIDTDGDGTPDCQDSCPNDPGKVVPGVCGCGISDVDSDGDGVANCSDLCPNDPLKVQPGACGCGIADQDLDGNGIPDCNEITGQAGQCTELDIRGYQQALLSTLSAQQGQLTRLLADVRLRCGNSTDVRRFVKRLQKRGNRWGGTNAASISSLPFTIRTSCPDALGCRSSVVMFDDSGYTVASRRIRRAVNRAVAYRLACLNGGRCEGTPAECARRVRLRQRLARKERRLARDLDASNLSTVKLIPRTTFTCGGE